MKTGTQRFPVRRQRLEKMRLVSFRRLNSSAVPDAIFLRALCFVLLPMALAQEAPRINGTNFTLVYYYYSPRPYAFRESENLWLPVLPLVRLNDTDSYVLTSAYLRFSEDSYHDDTLLYAPEVSDITGFWDTKVGTLTMIGAQTVPYWQAALRSVLYRASNTLSLKQRPNRHNRYLTVEIVDGSGRTSRATQHIILETARTVITDRNGGVELSR